MADVEVKHLLAEAIRRHQSGQLAAAEGLYRKVLDRIPNEPDALQGLGLIAMGVGQLAAAEELLRRAVASAPGVAYLHGNLGEALRQAGRLEKAVSSFQTALRLDPNFAHARHNMNLALSSLGRADEAGIAEPRKSPQWFNLMGNSRLALGDLEGAQACYAKALELDPDDPDSLRNLGMSLNRQARFDQSAQTLRKLLSLRPDDAEGLNLLGESMCNLGRIDDAVRCHQRALNLNPRMASAASNVGRALARKGDYSSAVDWLRRAIELDPAFVDSWQSLGLAYQNMGWLDEASAAYEQTLKLSANRAVAFNNLGNVLKDQARLDDAIACYRRAAELSPGAQYIHSNLLYTMFYRHEDPRVILDEHLRWAAAHADPLLAAAKPFANDAHPDRTLRIGYVSANLRNHPLGILMEPLISRHDPTHFEVFIYYDSIESDDQSRRFQKMGHWREVAGMDDRQLAERIRADRIDILIDLSSHMAGTRLMCFARRPAPVQAAYMAYPATTGMKAMDWLISDVHLDPPGQSEGFCVERIARLPRTYWVYDPSEPAPDVGPSPAARNNYVTFGCLNNFCKLNETTLRQWARILQSVPGSQLRVLSKGDPDHNGYPARWFASCAINKDCVRFLPLVPRAKYLQYYNDIDIVLDTFPCNGHTTSLDALWMGCAVVSRAGRHAMGRAGISILSNLRLTEWIANDDQAYEAMAIRLARNPAALGEMRADLRRRLCESPLSDAPGVTRELEALYRQMWREGRPEKPPTISPTLGICIVLANRSRRQTQDGRVLELFPDCVRSLAANLPVDERVELIVADYQSTDWPLSEWIEAAAGAMSVRVVSMKGFFSRGGGLNAAARAAQAPLLFFCDADLIVPSGFLAEGIEHVRMKNSFFPMCTMLDAAGQPTNRCSTGYGLAFVDRALFESVGGWPELTRWGGEDDEFWEKCRAAGSVRRRVVPDLVHQWHPLEWRDEAYAAEPKSGG